ncbi:MAG: InlB B-repeat-containing protein [Eubacteriales bacterium]
MMKFSTKRYPITVLLCLLCLCALLCACRHGQGDITTTAPEPESTPVISDETTADLAQTGDVTTDGTTAEESTEDITEETTEQTTGEVTTEEVTTEEVTTEEVTTEKVTTETSPEITEPPMPDIYTVRAETRYGTLLGGGQSFTFSGTLEAAEAFMELYDGFTADDVIDGAYIHRFKEVAIEKDGTNWTLTLVWESELRRFGVILDYGMDYDLSIINAEYEEKIVLPTPDGREDVYRYYDFIGWRAEDGSLIAGGSELSITSDMLLTAEFANGEMKLYEIVFKTDIGLFENGKNETVIFGHYGDTVAPPLPPDSKLLIFGEVVYEFAGWNKTPSAILGNAEYIALFTTPQPVYFLELYLNGEPYLSVPHYAGVTLSTPVRPEQTAGLIFSGWQGLPEVMPESDIRIDAFSRPAEVVYIVDGEVILRTQTTVGSVVTVAAVPQKVGHTVSGWSTSDVTELTDGAFEMPEWDVVFSAESTPNTYNIVYILEGQIVYTDQAVYGELYALRGIEVMCGYDFIPWQSQDISLNIGNGIFTMPDKDITFIGAFKKCEYFVNYYLDGELIFSDKYGYGDEVTLRPPQVQEGCTFAWTTAGAEISDGRFTMPAGNVDIYGHFSDGDNRIIFMIDGIEYGTLGAPAGEHVDISFAPTKIGYTFTGWSSDEVDVSGGSFVMPEGVVVLRGSFIPNVHHVTFVDLESGETIAENYVDYGAEFSIVGSIYCKPGRVSNGLILISGNAVGDGESYTMPDEDVVFGITWEECLTVELEEDYIVPYYALIGAELESCRYDEETKTLHIYDPAVKVSGASEGVTVVYEYTA